jgi:two-component system KDP operon response regulator KdpE
MTVGNTILVIDDEIQIRKLLDITLSANQYHIIAATNGKEGLVAAATQHPDLILLDLGLPDEDGQSILVKLREWFDKPIIILSVRNSESDIVTALDNGATDYLTKPFRSGELLARIRSAFRLVKDSSGSASILNFHGITLDLNAHIIRKNNEVLKLTSTEYSLLTLLAKNAGKVLTHQFILKEIWGFGYIEQTQYLRVFIAQLRKKIEDNPSTPEFIITESGIGYRFKD